MSLYYPKAYRIGLFFPGILHSHNVVIRGHFMAFSYRISFVTFRLMEASHTHTHTPYTIYSPVRRGIDFAFMFTEWKHVQSFHMNIDGYNSKKMDFF